MTMYIGLDVHSKSTVYFAQSADGERIGNGRISTNPTGFVTMVATLEAPTGTKIGLESGAQAKWVSEVLKSIEMDPVVIDAGEVRRKARKVRQKSDKRDAFDICDGLRRDIYDSIVYVPSPEVQLLRMILSRRNHFVKIRTRQINAAKYLLRMKGLSHKVKQLRKEQHWNKMLEDPELTEFRPFLVMHFRMWYQAMEATIELEKRLDDALEPFADVHQRLQTVPGVGTITSAAFIAVLGTPHRFPTSKQVTSYLGLAVATFNSGDRVCHGHITKTGSSMLRGYLCEAAQSIGRSTHPLYPYYARACSRSGFKKAVICVAQRLGRIMYRMWKNEKDFEISKLNVVYEPNFRTRKRLYRIKKDGDK